MNSLEVVKTRLARLDAEIESLCNEIPDYQNTNNYLSFYGALGADGNNGVLLPVGDNRNGGVYEGRIIINSGGPFVCTDILVVTQPIDISLGGGVVGSPFYPVNAYGSYQFRFTDEGSGRRLFQGDNENREDVFISPTVLKSVLTTPNLFPAATGFAGPERSFSLPQPHIFARNTVIKVEVKAYIDFADWSNNQIRVYASLLGNTQETD